jgi:hypothetical protein
VSTLATLLTAEYGRGWGERQLWHCLQIVEVFADPEILNTLPEQGFGAAVRSALRTRLAFLIEEGLAERRADKVVLRGNVLATLRDREFAKVGQRLESELGLRHHPPWMDSPLWVLIEDHCRSSVGVLRFSKRTEVLPSVPWRQCSTNDWARWFRVS